MKSYIYMTIACFLFIVSMAFVIQVPQQDSKRDSADKSVKPLDIPRSSKSDDLFTQIDSLKRELAVEKKKSDSVNMVRERNLSITQRSVVDLRKANEQYRKSLSRLKYILERFPADSVMKFYGEYKDADAVQEDTLKKKTSTAVIVLPQRKRNLFQRIFNKNP